MNWRPAGAGFEPKRMALLGALVLVLVYFLWPSSHGNEGAAPVRPAARATAAAPVAGGGPAEAAEARTPATVHRGSGRAAGNRDSVEEFRPSLRKVRLANTDPSRIDPTLRLDLLAKLQNVKLEGSMRSLFEVSEAPALAIREPAAVHSKGPVKPMPQVAADAPPPGPPPTPPPPAIPLKFYGFVNPGNVSDRRAFFLDGEDILVAREGETLQKRYKIVRIGVNSAVVEDIQFSNQQSLPLVAEAQSAG